MDTDLLLDLQESGYRNLRVLEDGTIVGTQDLLFTRALFVDLGLNGWAFRYCYEDRELAVKACNQLRSGGDAPLPGFVARRVARG